MKKFIFIALLIFCLSGVVQAGQFPIVCGSVYDGTIAASGTANGDTLQTRDINGYQGYFSIQPVFTGTGTLLIQYQISNGARDASGDLIWDTAVQIVASASTGEVYPYPAAGVNIFSGYQRLVFTETGTANNVVVTGAYRCAQ